MDKKVIINKIKVFLGMVKEKFETLKLQDGVEISTEALEINREVFDAEGNPLTAGEYILEDGTKFTVDENGVIKEIERPDGEETKEEVVTEEMGDESKAEGTGKPTTDTGKPENAEEKPADPASKSEPTDEPTNDPSAPGVEDRLNMLEQKVDEMYEILLAITEKLQAGETKVEETIEEFKKFKAQPSATPLHFNKEQEDTPKRRIDVLKQFKNNQ